MRGLHGNEAPADDHAPVPDAVAQTNTHFFTDRQIGNLTAAQRNYAPPWSKAIPERLDAGTPEFLDFLIGISPPDRQGDISIGSGSARRGSPGSTSALSFAAVEKDTGGSIAAPLVENLDDGPSPRPNHLLDFINVAHSDIRTATINSQAWDDAAREAGRPGS